MSATSDGTSRARFLGGAAALAGLAAGGVGARTARAAPGPASRTYTSGRFAFELDGALVGLVSDIDGGAVSAEVVETSSSSNYPDKELGELRYHALFVKVGFGDKQLMGWISDSWKGAGTTKDVQVISTDANLTSLRERTFEDALLIATTVPEVDANSKDTVWLELKILASSIAEEPGTGTVKGAAPSKHALGSHFRLKLDNLDCSRVSKIHAFTVRQGDDADYVSAPIGGGPGNVVISDPDARVQLAVAFPSLVVEFGDGTATASDFRSWFEDFVLDGNSGNAQERNGSLELLAPNFQSVVATIKLFNVGIFSLAPVWPQAGSNSVGRMTAELYVERMELVA